MSRISMVHSHPRPCSGEKTLRRCSGNNGEADNVITIDVESENFENIVIIDITGSLPKKKIGPSKLTKERGPSHNIIYIDDDENPDNSHPHHHQSSFPFETRSADNSHPVGAKKDSHFSAGTFSNSRRVPKKTVDSQDNAIPVRLSKCKRTYSGKVAARNRYGLGTDSESDSDDDSPDCELVEDFGKVQELWEKASSSRRKKDIHNGPSSSRNHDNTPPVINTDHQQNVRANDASRQKERVSSRSRKDIHSGPSNIRDHDTTSPVINRDRQQNVETKNATRQHKKVPFCSSSGKFSNESDAPSHFRAKKGTDIGENPASYNSAFQEHSSKEFNDSISASKEKGTSTKAACPPCFESRVDRDSRDGNSIRVGDENSSCQSKKIPFESEENIGLCFKGGYYHENFVGATTKSVNEKEYVDMDTLMPEICSLKSSTLHKKDYCEGNSQPVIDFRKSHCSKVKLGDINRVSNIQHEEEVDKINEETLPSTEICVINDREKLKETDEYKRATEAEWASRQQALQIQAEEAQCQRRLLKRQKAESMRLLDMERRQKQRLEEIRSTQKKDEENLNMKEKIRAEVRMELKKVEIACKDLASLLHLSGINVGGWPKPSPQEVQTAYKRALLKFHPDRASKSDIRQQVEAEEKFKLINRLKEKFSPNL